MPTKKNQHKGESIASSIAPSENDALARDLAQCVTTAVAAEILGVSPNHIRLLLGRNKIRGIKLGHDWIAFVPSLVKYKGAKSPKGLGCIPQHATYETAHHILGELISPDRYYPLHINLIRHGREICVSGVPRCEICPLTDVCKYYRKTLR